MEYLGETYLNINETGYSEYTREDWAMFWIENYGQFDGEHHKQWALDQVARILKGTQIIIKEASWSNGHTELRFMLADPSPMYKRWVKNLSFDYNEGTAP